MPTLLLQLIGPMQSWGVQSNFTHRDTGLEPSKSGVIGLICAALGRGRGETVHDLAALRMGVRVDQEGILLKDYHTAGKKYSKDGGYFLRANGDVEKNPQKGTIPSDRYYLADAAFLVGLEGADVKLLTTIQQALRHPTWHLFLGRKAFAPSARVWIANLDSKQPDGIRDVSLEDALKTHSRIVLESRRRDWLAIANEQHIRMVIEDKDGVEIRSDQPISFEKGNRRFTVRRVTTVFVATENAISHALPNL